MCPSLRSGKRPRGSHAGQGAPRRWGNTTAVDLRPSSETSQQANEDVQLQQGYSTKLTNRALWPDALDDDADGVGEPARVVGRVGCEAEGGELVNAYGTSSADSH